MVRIRPVIVQAFRYAFRAFGDVGLYAAPRMHLEVFVGAGRYNKQLLRGAGRIDEPEDGDDFRVTMSA